MANKFGHYIDSTIGTLFPKWGFNRSFNRVRMQTMQSQSRRYEGAGEGRRASSWISNGNPDVNRLIAKDLAKLVLRSRELTINNSYSKKAPYVIANNVVGTGIVATVVIADKIENGKVKALGNKDALKDVFTTAWKDWSEKLSCDYSGDFNFSGLQHLAIRSKVVSGEILAIRKRVKADVNKFGFQILMLECDYIDTTKDTLQDKDGGYTFRGIKYNKDRKRSGYWLYDRHPSEGNAVSEIFPIEDIIHLYEVERAGQNRGVPDAAPTIQAQRDLADYTDAELLKQKGAACFSAIVQKNELPEGGDNESDRLESLEPGIVQYLNPGETIHFPSLPQNPGLNEFVKTQLRSVAAGYLMPYENLTGDLSNVTFISGRLGQLDFKKQVEYWQHTSFIPKFCERIFQWFVDGAKIAYSINKEIEVKGTWTAPRWQMMDPVKEVAADVAEVRAGFSSWEEKVKQNGYDPEQLMKELTENQEAFIKNNLMPYSNQFFELNAKVKMNAGKSTE